MFRLVLLWFCGVALSSVGGRSEVLNPKWNRPIEPFQIVANLYYVGASDVSVYLITTPEGHILIDGGFGETVPLIEANLARLGFRLEDVRVLLISHGHYDHVGGIAELKAKTKARLLVNPAEKDLLMHGGTGDFAFGDKYPYSPVQPDGELADGDEVRVGDAVLKAHFTPGHTKGCVTWTMVISEGGQSYDVVIAASLTAPGYQLVGNEAYPGIISDYEKSIRTLRALPCDIFLSLHSWDFGLHAKIAARGRDARTNPFVDPAGYRRFLDKAETNLKKQAEDEERRRRNQQAGVPNARN